MTHTQSLFIGLLLIGWGCSEQQASSKLPPAIDIRNYDPALAKTDAGWLYHHEPFSGYMIETETDGRVVYRLPILNGHESGLAKGWYNSGEKLMERWFVAGKKEGLYKQWWPNGRFRYLFHYKHDEYDGVQYVFFPNGRKRETSHYQNGIRDGVQRVWNEQGQLVSNYTIRYQKLYGVLTIESCIPPADFQGR